MRGTEVLVFEVLGSESVKRQDSIQSYDKGYYMKFLHHNFYQPKCPITA